MAPDVLKRLQTLEHKFVERPRQMGDCEAIMSEDGAGVRLGASDPRLAERSVGY